MMRNLHHEIYARLEDRSLEPTPENVADVCRTGLDTIAACRGGSSDWYEPGELVGFARAFRGGLKRAATELKKAKTVTQVI